ncbi:MAG: hypothetical protein GXO62_07150 [Epsilonproteobacteria bacterium]|nr:hypothetical protein [Campylobacterota bacterium]
MDKKKRLSLLIDSSMQNAQMLKEGIDRIKKFYPLDSNFREDISKEMFFVLDSVLFRFAKLQDSLGNKIFRLYLENEGVVVNGMNFMEILKILEKEGVLEIDIWAAFREVRNELSHDYPDDDKIAQNINFVIENAYKLIEVLENIKRRNDEIE